MSDRRAAETWRLARRQSPSRSGLMSLLGIGVGLGIVLWRMTRALAVRPALQTRLGRLTVLGNVLCWHQDPQNVLTAVALGEQLFDELEQTLQRVTSYRMHLLSDGDGALCERKPFCFRP